jgi:hypothetical protein
MGSVLYLAYSAGLCTDPSAWWKAAEPFKFAMNQSPHLLDQCIVINTRIYLQEALEMVPFSSQTGVGNGLLQLTDTLHERNMLLTKTIF